MIKRVLIILSIAAVIVFVPYFIGILFISISWLGQTDYIFFVWAIGLFAGIGTAMIVSLIFSVSKEIIKYIIKG